MAYDPKSIEEKWRKWWQDNKSYRVENDTAKPKYYVLDMFPYPSGAGLHVGHPLGYIASDIVARFKRHQGFNVLHPMGYDSFGLPAEQYAIQTGQHPAKTTEVNLARYREQLDRIGFSFDWSREVRTSDPAYYKWTQWIFIQLFESWYDHQQQKAKPISELIARFEQQGWSGEDHSALTGDVEEELNAFSPAEWKAFDERKQRELLLHFRLAYLSEAWVNWCPALGTVLANDEVKDGVSERGGHPVERKRMPQWSMRITAYAQRLLTGLDTLDWSESIKESQRNWIGRSEGALVRFGLTPALSRGEGALSLTPGPSPGERGADPGKDRFRETSALGAWSNLSGHSKSMRHQATEAEDALWQQIRGNATGGRIRRQHVIDRFIVDFVSLPKQLVIEVDGDIHDLQKEADAQRTARLNELGFEVIRFSNSDVLADPQSVRDRITQVLSGRRNFAKDEEPEEHDEAHFSPSLREKGLGDEVHSSPLPGRGVRGEAALSIDVFTTRPDTLFGVTFVTLAPEHELVEAITTADRKAEVMEYVNTAKNRSERDRQADVKKVSGVFTGAYVTHPFTGADIPVWVGDYVLGGYGTGAVMAVPGGDQRDWNFATHFGLPIIAVTEGADITKEADERKDATISSEGFLKGLKVPDAMKRSIDELVKLGAGERRVNFRLRDAAFGRQRYWGEPIPIYYKDGIPHALPESDLPLVLPEVDKFLPTEDGEPPLARAKNWSYSPSPREKGQGDEASFPLETTTMPGWAGSSWYFLRYMDPHNADRFASPEAIKYWQQIDLYLGGSEHATGHLLYFRFWTKFLFDRGWLPFDEPAKKLVNQGMIQGKSAAVYRYNAAVDMFGLDDSIAERVFSDWTILISSDLVVKLHPLNAEGREEAIAILKQDMQELSRKVSLEYQPGKVEFIVNEHLPLSISRLLVLVDFFEEDRLVDTDGLTGWLGNMGYTTRAIEYVTQTGRSSFRADREVDKMSKSKYNVVNPDDIIERYGADTLRLYEMFLGPLEQSKPWDTNGIEGTSRFLKKFWNLFHSGEGGKEGDGGKGRDGGFRVSDEAPTKEELKTLHSTLKKVTEDIEKMSFNTSVSQFMIAVNQLGELKCNKREVLEPLTIALAPFAPHIAEELWSLLGHTESITKAPWPKWEASYLVEDSFSYPISFNGKTRMQLEFPIALDAKSIELAVLANPEVQQRLEGQAPKKVIVVPKRIVNIVV